MNNYLLFRTKRKIKLFGISNIVIKDLQKHQITLDYLYKLNKSFIESYNTDNKKRTFSKKVWICWLQGIESAPLLVKKCFDSVKKAFDGYEINVITNDNYMKFVDIPNYINEKKNSGVISYTHFSDILRAELLSKYGGIWLDATVFCTTDTVPKYLFDSDLFVYKEVNLNRNDDVPIVASSWFIKSNSNNPILLLTRDLLRNYWKNSNVLIDYYLFHLFFTLSTKKYDSEWNDLMLFNNANPHIMQFELLNKYDNKRIEYYKKISDFHKLSYKINKNKITKESTYYKIFGGK